MKMWRRKKKKEKVRRERKNKEKRREKKRKEEKRECRLKLSGEIFICSFRNGRDNLVLS